MAYLSLYRKWRPQTFDDVTGQPHIVTTLQNSLRSDRVSHAYLFSGPRGTGKTTVARLMAKGLNCVHGPTPNPCGVCSSCEAILRGTFLDVIEIDGASNRGIDEIRELREQIRYAPSEGRYKVYIIDEVHMLTIDAFNALLKTLEEPPAHVVFIVATTDLHKIPATILSRCQRYDFKRFTVNQICERLETVLAGEGVKAARDALELIAAHAAGGMRDALGILDQCMAYSSEVTAHVVGEILGVVSQEELESFKVLLASKDSRGAVKLVQELYDLGKDLGQFARDVIRFFREGLRAFSAPWTMERVLLVLEEFSRCERDMRYAFDAKIPLELAILRFVDALNEEEGLRERVAHLETRLKELEEKGVVIRGKPEETGNLDALAPTGLSMTALDEEKLDQIRSRWNGFLDALRSERHVQPEAFLREGTPLRVQEDVLTIEFSKERGFHKASIEQPKHKEPAERILSRYFGIPLRIACVNQEKREGKKESLVTDDKKDQGEDLSAPKDALEPAYCDSVKAALATFGGRVIQVKGPET